MEIHALYELYEEQAIRFGSTIFMGTSTNLVIFAKVRSAIRRSLSHQSATIIEIERDGDEEERDHGEEEESPLVTHAHEHLLGE